MNTAKQMKALVLLNELQSLLPPEADAYVATQVDRPGFLDLNLDTPEQSEVDALAIYQRGLDKAYNDEVQAWDFWPHAAQAANGMEDK